MSGEVKKPEKRENKPFKRFMRLLFVESWGLKILALLFAAAVWIIFKSNA